MSQVKRIPDISQIIPSKLKLKKIKYKNHDELKIDVPMRACFIGKTGSCKTNALVALIREMGCFTRIYLFVKDPTESYYQFLIDEMREVEKKTGMDGQLIFYSNDLSQLPTYDKFNPKFNNLVVMDDLINEKSKELGTCGALWTMGRKRNISSVFISQSYFKIPKLIRDNTDYFFILKVQSVMDLHRILNEYQLDLPREIMDQMYYKATAEKGQFFLIDLVGPDNLRYRWNYTPFIFGRKETETID